MLIREEETEGLLWPNCLKQLYVTYVAVAWEILLEKEEKLLEAEEHSKEMNGKL